MTSSAPDWLIVPAYTSDPTVFRTGVDSPVIVRLIDVGIAALHAPVHWDPFTWRNEHRISCAHDFRHQAVHGASCRGNPSEDLTAFHFVIERPGDRIDLATNPGDAFRQLRLLPNRV